MLIAWAAMAGLVRYLRGKLGGQTGDTLGALAETGETLFLLAMVSSLRDRPLPQDLVVFGEVGLAGEIRPVPSGQERISEAAKHGFRRAIVPAANVPKKLPEGMKVFPVKKLSDALSVFDDL
jgi:DNA repair protein RadA/Sms